MKITPEHFSYLQTEIKKMLDAIPDLPAVIKNYETGNIPRANPDMDLQMRFCFDCLYAAKLSPWVCEHIYKYANDTHLYTALKQICPKVEKKF